MGPEGLEIPADSRPASACDPDISVWTKAVQRAHAPVVAGQLTPQILGAIVKDGVQAKVLWGALLMEKARQSGKPFVQVSLDLPDAHNEYGREAAQERPRALQAARPREHTWADLASAHRADTGHSSRIYMRSDDTDNGLKFLCEGTAGGPQGSAITNVAFPVLIESPLKGLEAKPTSVEVRGIQDDIGLYGDPKLIPGDDGALMWLLPGLAKDGLKPS